MATPSRDASQTALEIAAKNLTDYLAVIVQPDAGFDPNVLTGLETAVQLALTQRATAQAQVDADNAQIDTVNAQIPVGQAAIAPAAAILKTDIDAAG
jgi:hypothetical protein